MLANGETQNAPATQAYFNPATVVRVYSGRKGCACGCRGNYSERPATIKRIMNEVSRLLAEGGHKVLVDAEFIGVDCADRDRAYTLYFS